MTQCVTNWECLIEQAHVAKVGDVKAFAKLCCQTLRQRRQQLLPISRPPGPLLLELHNMPSDLPTGLHLDGIDRSQHFLAGFTDQLAKISEQ